MQARRTLATAATAVTIVGMSGLAAVTASSARAAPAATAAASRWVVLADTASSADAVAAELRRAGATVTSVNDAIGLVTATSTDAAFRNTAGKLAGVQGVASDVSIGVAPRRAAPDAVEREHLTAGLTGGGTAGDPAEHPTPTADPLDNLLWGMKMINAPQAHAKELGDRRVTVGVLDTGIQADHPDLAARVDTSKSRNFVTDIEAIDGPCEHPGCKDPATEDDDGHGTHVAGTIAASLNGFGVSGVAPGVTLVNIRGGQDSGYFFLGPVVNALTYAGDIGIDAVNMSFYVDPWLYNCVGGAPEDSAAAAADQKVIIEGMTRALQYAHKRGVTLVGSLGNEHADISDPGTDASSPDYDNPDNDATGNWDKAPYSRTIDDTKCFDLPLEGPHVLGVSALGPSGRKADYSNYATEPAAGEIELSAPGGWFRDGFGTPSYRTPQNMILSSVPLVALQDTKEVDADGNITPLGQTNGVIKQCTTKPDKGAASCGYYAYFQGTSMAAPHATGVAALAVSAHGHSDGRRGLTMDPDAVRRLLQSTATDHACPAGGKQAYTDEGRDASFTATCVGTTDFNGFYGAGIVNALGVVKH
jgi:subtilisin family serine protease